MAHGQGATSNRRTSARGTLGRGPRFGMDPNQKKAVKRERDERWQRAKEETDKARQELEELIEQQRREPAVGEVAGAMYAAQEKEAKEKLDAAQAAQKAETERIKEEVKALEKIVAKPVRKQFLDPEPTKSETGLPMYAPLWKFEKNFDPAKLPQQGDGNQDFAVTFAIKKLKMGYHVSVVLEEFGIGVTDLPEGLFDELGWGIRPEHKENSNGTTSSD